MVSLLHVKVGGATVQRMEVGQEVLSASCILACMNVCFITDETGLALFLQCLRSS